MAAPRHQGKRYQHNPGKQAGPDNARAARYDPHACEKSSSLATSLGLSFEAFGSGDNGAGAARFGRFVKSLTPGPRRPTRRAPASRDSTVSPSAARIRLARPRCGKTAGAESGAVRGEAVGGSHPYRSRDRPAGSFVDRCDGWTLRARTRRRYPGVFHCGGLAEYVHHDLALNLRSRRQLVGGHGGRAGGMDSHASCRHGFLAGMRSGVEKGKRESPIASSLTRGNAPWYYDFDPSVGPRNLSMMVRV